MVLIDTCTPDKCVDECYADTDRFTRCIYAACSAALSLRGARRITSPVQEVTAEQIQRAAGGATTIIVMAKHLCGDAADSMLHQVTRRTSKLTVC